jgi:catechol 2,3-dioxygenase-like lactoylglutathione lyase family enzyme
MKTIPAFLLLLAPFCVSAQSTGTPPFRATGAFFALSVADLEASTRWYTDKFGLRVVQQPPSSGGVSARILEGGGLIVELIHNPAAVPLSKAAPAITHTTLVHGVFKTGIIVENYDATLAALRARGVEIAIGPFPAHDGQRANFIVRDNSGNLIQFFGRAP